MIVATVAVENLLYQEHKRSIAFCKIMSLKPIYSSTRYSSCSSPETDDLRTMKTMSSATSPSSQSLLHTKDTERKSATAGGFIPRSNDNSGRPFLSVRKNAGLLKSRSNVAERLPGSG